MIPAAFDYVRAASLTEAIGFLQDDPDGTKLVAGGHTLLPALKLRLASPNRLVDIGSIAELRGIEISGDTIRIGALTTHAELLASEPLNAELPIFRETARLIADPQVRNRGTIGGSLANADPAADWPAIAVALQAEIEIAGSNARRVAATDFFVDIFSTVLEQDEVLTALHIRKPASGMRFAYRKIRHPASGFAVVGVAAGICLTKGVVTAATVGITGAANRAFASHDAVDFLIGKALSRETIEQAARLASESTQCLSDRYASADYRANLIRIEVGRALLGLAS
ncbi:molybdopterin dehydrogenase FAD-binding protein [Bradyrhizobium oligotrophicum S58]|uniref:Molybdopterin dehydrogenase FAD-binding protein n=1 Tax=Bradyrhizobium oligotrophicum S58 TaxID=1245469 RepID=M4Z2Z3_9BRAD|nr:xanthine dehydrogenase family protein subunit M [Bradyrhizobium oligotrophicum]BAM87454.1 molybdopterin dehydrogenase FAD-binding protein [Bradyrhizobium oligotrophicum S58]